MRNRVLAVLSGATLLASSMTGTAAAAVEPEGVLCGYSSLTHPSSYDTQYAEVDAGPLTLVDHADPSAVVWGSVTCTVQFEERHGTTANDQASLTGSVTPGVVHVAGTVAFRYTDFETVYVCTRVDVLDGPPLYWDEETDGWSTSDTAACASNVYDPDDPHAGDEIGPLVDSVVCEAFEVVFPPEGDIDGIWDCPPYGS